MRDCIGEKFIVHDQVLSTDQFDKSLFMSGIILYEVIAFYNRKYLFLDDHMDRFEHSSQLSGLPLWIPIGDVREKVMQLLQINDVIDGSINVTFSFSREKTFVTYINNPNYPSDEDYLNGVKTQLHFDIRTTPNIKFFLQDFRERAGRKIKEHHLWEVILVDKNDFITEASRSNVFMIRDDEIITAPVELVLPGVTRKHVMRLCAELNIPVVEKCVKYTELNEMDAVFLTGTTSKVLPVKMIDGNEFNPLHPFIIRLREAYQHEIVKHCG